MLIAYFTPFIGYILSHRYYCTDSCLFYIFCLDYPLFVLSYWSHTYSSCRIQIKYLFYCKTISEPLKIDCFSPFSLIIVHSVLSLACLQWYRNSQRAVPGAISGDLQGQRTQQKSHVRFVG